MEKGGVIASFWRRVLAYIADIAIINLIVILPFKDTIKQISSDSYLTLLENGVSSSFYKILIITSIVAVLVIFYFSILEYKIQQTIGKMLLNIKVVTLNKKPRYSQFITRNILKLSTILIIIDSIPLAFNKPQRFSEKLAQTKVIKCKR